MAILICRCGSKNRLPSIPAKRIRCGNCQHEFKPAELSRATPEPPPARPAPSEFELDRETDGPPNCPTNCKRCGWTGWPDELDQDEHDRYRCPDCNGMNIDGIPKEGI